MSSNASQSGTGRADKLYNSRLLNLVARVGIPPPTVILVSQ